VTGIKNNKMEASEMKKRTLEIKNKEKKSIRNEKK
jgi:hypothetical protein